MKSLGKISVIVVSTALIWGAAAFSWHFLKARASARRLAQDANVCRARAENGDASAQYELAGLYYQGKGVPQDYKHAADWYRKAADQGNPKAQYGVGFMYYEGRGVQQTTPRRWTGTARPPTRATRKLNMTLATAITKEK